MSTVVDLRELAASFLASHPDRNVEAQLDLVGLLMDVRRRAMALDEATAEMHENEACALLVDTMLGDGNVVAQAIRRRQEGRHAG